MLSKRMALFALTDAQLDTSCCEVNHSLIDLIGLIDTWKNPGNAA